MWAVAWLYRGAWHFHVITDSESYARAELAYVRADLGLDAKLLRRK